MVGEILEKDVRERFTIQTEYRCPVCNASHRSRLRAEDCCPTHVFESETYICKRCGDMYSEPFEAFQHDEICHGVVEQAEEEYLDALRFGDPLKGLQDLLQVRGY